MSAAVPTGNVAATGVEVRMRAKKNSLKVIISEKIEVAASPGAASGSTISRNERSRVAPSTIAASSRSMGISWKKERIIQATKGKLNAV